MTLLDLCEPIFQEVCDLKRVARNFGDAAIAQIPNNSEEERFLALLQQAEQTARADPVLAGQFADVRKALVYFIDDVMFQNRQDWRYLEATLFNTAAGAAAFYAPVEGGHPGPASSLTQLLQTPGTEAEEKLKVYYTCLALGFAGMHQGNPAEIQTCLRQIRQRLRNTLEENPTGIICEKAYFVDHSRIYEKPTRWVPWVLAGFGILSVASLVFCLVLFQSGSKKLSQVLKGINSPKSAATAQP